MSETPPTLRFCPICDGSLCRVESESVVVDVCDEHGVFVDHDELAVLERRGVRGVRIGLHASISRDMERPFMKPVPQGKVDSMAERILHSVFELRARANHRPENAGEPPAPKLDRSNQEVVPDGMRACPQCSALMQLDERKDVWGRTETVILDTCKPHGVWLDHSELMILLDRSNQDARRNARRARRRAIEWAKDVARSRSH